MITVNKMITTRIREARGNLWFELEDTSGPNVLRLGTMACEALRKECAAMIATPCELPDKYEGMKVILDREMDPWGIEVGIVARDS